MAWVIADANRKNFRRIADFGWTGWTEDVDEALQFARRRDAEAFCAEDEDAWCITTVNVIKRDKRREKMSKNHVIAAGIILEELSLGLSIVMGIAYICSILFNGYDAAPRATIAMGLFILAIFLFGLIKPFQRYG